MCNIYSFLSFCPSSYCLGSAAAFTKIVTNKIINLITTVLWSREESEVVKHLRQRVAVLLVRDNVAMLCSRSPTFTPAEVDGDIG